MTGCVAQVNPHIAIPVEAVDALIAAVRGGQTHYTAAAGTVEAREAIAGDLRRNFRLHYTGDEVIVTNGANDAIVKVCQKVAAGLCALRFAEL